MTSIELRSDNAAAVAPEIMDALEAANVGSALPVAGAIAVGPGLGAALLILSEIFKDPLKDMSRIHYRVTGDWDDPVIERVQPSELAATGEAVLPSRN